MNSSATEEQVLSMISAADADKDGKVSKPEFVRFMSRKHYPSPQSEVEKAFVTLAENDIPGKSWPKESGMIHVDKLRFVMKTFVVGFGDEEIDRLMRKASRYTSSDSMVDYKAFAKMLFTPHDE